MEFTLPVRLPAKAPGKSGRLDLDSRIRTHRTREHAPKKDEFRLPCMIADFPRKSKRNRRAGGICTRKFARGAIFAKSGDAAKAFCTLCRIIELYRRRALPAPPARERPATGHITA